MTGPSDDTRTAASEPYGSKDLCDGAKESARAESPASKSGGQRKRNGAANRGKQGRNRSRLGHGPSYGALDLGTNNCRLLVARPSRRGFLVVDAFSRIIRLGEGMGRSGRLSEAAMVRTIEALKVCAQKLVRNRVRRSRLIATEACRVAENADEFIERVQNATGLALEVVSRETEAKLAVSGCASLIDRKCDWALVFDIGGGSSELIWLDLSKSVTPARHSIHERVDLQGSIAAWTSLPAGVVTLAERHGGQLVTRNVFEAMVDDVSELIARCDIARDIGTGINGSEAHLLGTSGTVTTIAGIHLGLEAYDRSRVDGCWLAATDARAVSESLMEMSYEERVAQPCVGRDRADLVLAGCAIFEAVLRAWPCERLRVADRGLREGILATLMAEDGYPRSRRRQKGRGKSNGTQSDGGST